MQSPLLEHVKITRSLAAVAAGTTVQAGSAVDMAGYDGVLFVALFGTLTATQTTSLKAQQSSDNAVADDFSDLEGSSVGPMGDDDDGLMLALDVWRPVKQYVKPVVVRGVANAVIDGVIAIRYAARNKPTVQDITTLLASKSIVTPDEGTA